MKAALLTRDEARDRAALITVVAYDVQVDVTGDEGALRRDVFASRATVTFASARPGADTFVDVIAERIATATLNGEPVDLDGYDGRRLPLRRLAESNELVVAGEFRFNDNMLGLGLTVDPADDETYLFSMAFMSHAQRVFACFDQPDLKARFTFTVTAPGGWTVVSNGAAADGWSLPNGARVTRFATTKPMPTYVTAVMAGPFHHAADRVDGPAGPIELGLYCMRSDASFLDEDECFALTKAGFDLFHRTFGTPYPFDKYDQIFRAEPGYGGMENAGLVAFGGGFIFRSRATETERLELACTLLHELSHMWFGNLVTARWWDDTWLNEAFATYAEYFAAAEATRWHEAWTTFAQEKKSQALLVDQRPTTHPVATDAADLQGAIDAFDHISYAKGASVLRQLVAYVGRGAFETALRGYFRDHAFGNASLHDLLDALEKASGRDLHAWSAQWLESAEVNTLRPEFTVDDQDRFASFAVVQTAPVAHPVLRAHRLVVGCYDEGPTGRLGRVRRVETDVDGPRTEIPELVGKPACPLVVVNDEDLTYAKVRFDPRSAATVRAHVGRIDDSLTRAVCWTALWDMTRDGELAAGEYVDAVVRGAPHETRLAVLRELLTNAEHAVAEYVDPDRSAAARERLAGAAWRALHDATAGVDHQLAWLRLFASVAGRTTSRDRLRFLYDGRLAVDGLVLDGEARWTLLRGLAAAGLADAAEIDTLLEADRHAASLQHAAAARASLPTPEAKAWAWEVATDPSPDQAPVRHTVARAFWADGSASTLTPYVDRYFAGLSTWWLQDDGVNAEVYTEHLRPRLVDADIVRRCDAWLASDHPARQRRMILDYRADMARALRNRSVDAGSAA